MIKDKVMVIQEGLANDLKAEKFKSEVTMDVLREVAIRIYIFLDFTLDVSNGEGRPVACLDTQIWWEKQDMRRIGSTMRSRGNWHQEICKQPPDNPEQVCDA